MLFDRTQINPAYVKAPKNNYNTGKIIQSDILAIFAQFQIITI